MGAIDLVNLKNRVTAQTMSYIGRIIKFEICEVDKVRWHKTKADHDYNVSDVVIRDRRMLVDPLFNYVRKRIPALQLPSGKFSGHPTNPRRGNLVKVLFYKLRKGLVLNQISSKKEPPVCRPDPYTERTKFCQYRPLYQDSNKDFPKDFPDPKKPTCENWQHGPCFGDQRDDEKEPCLGRDYWHVFDYCVEGDSDPSCEKCTDIDYCKRCKNAWLKIYSANTMSCQAPNRRVELHTYCGSYLRFENECGKSVEYSEGKSHIRLGNATCEADKRAHLNLQGSEVSGDDGVGTWDLHTNHEEVPLASESQGVRFAGVRPEDMQVDWAYELINFPTQSYIRCYKNGKIEINSCAGSSVIIIDGTENKVTVNGTANVLLKATDKVTCDTPLTHILQNMQIDGFCFHDGCSCGAAGGAGGGPCGWPADGW